MMRKAFTNPTLEDLFTQQGWLVYDLPSEEILNEIEILAIQILPKLPNFGFFVTFQSTDIELRRLVGNKLQAILSPFILSMLDSYKPVTGNFFVNRKLPQQPSGLGVHLDWSHINEHESRSIAAWVPLQDCTSESGFGQMGVLAGSHLGPIILRGSSALNGNLPPGNTQLYSLLSEKYPAQTLQIRKGQFLLFEHRLAHFSTPNEQSDPRISAHAVFIPAEADLLHYREQQDGETLAHLVNPSFFTDFVFTSQIPGCSATRPLTPEEKVALKHTLAT